MRSERGLQGFKLSWIISTAAMELDDATQGKPSNYSCTEALRETLEKHYTESKSKNSLGYNEEVSLIEALAFEVIPKTFNITPENCKKYEIQDYLAGLELINEQFKDIKSADKQRLEFLREFTIDLGNKRLSRIEPPMNYRYFAA